MAPLCNMVKKVIILTLEIFLIFPNSAYGKEVFLPKNQRPITVPADTILPVVTAPIFTARMYDYGPKFHDKELPFGVDSVMDVILTKSVVFYGQSFSYAYILSNGGIAFDRLVYPYNSQIFGNSSQPMIAAFWSRNDLRKGGVVFYREVISGPVLERGRREIQYQYGIETKPKSALIVTWENMQPHKEGIFLQTEDTNTFQSVIFMTDQGTFVNFIYRQIGWGLSAKAGFNSGKGSSHVLPRSGTKSVVYLAKHGNTGIPGEWMFRVDREQIISCKPGIKGQLCNKVCSDNEWGNDCSKRCKCPTGNCDAATGDCD